MQIENYINDLLYRYDCVIVPNFGAFLSNRLSAKLHDSTQTFYPPKKIISFNESLMSNDGLLANYIAEVEKIPFQNALTSIEKQVNAIKMHLKNGESVTFENIGSVIYNAENKIVFEPSYQVNFLSDAFGLSHFVTEKVNREAYKKEVEQIEEVVPITITPASKEKQTHKKRPVFAYAAASIVLAGMMSFFGFNYYKNSVTEYNKVAHQEADKKVDAEVQQATFIISNPLPVAELKLKKQNQNFHIMAGVFRFEQNGFNLISELKSLGYDAKIIGRSPSGLYQVVYDSYSSRDEADKALLNIKKSHNPYAWVLEKKLN